MKSKTAVTCCGQGTYIETEKENGVCLHRRKHSGSRPDCDAGVEGAASVVPHRRDWRSLDVTVEEGLQQLESRVCGMMELLDSASGHVLARQVPEPNGCQKQLLEALGLSLPGTVSRLGGGIRWL